MAARNGPAFNDSATFGWVSRLIHWLMAVGIIGMLGFGTYIANMTPTLHNLSLYGLHKSIGLCLLVLVVVRVLWHRISPPPAILTEGIAPWQSKLAHWVHVLLYALMIGVPLTGWIASAATGIDVLLFDTITLPRIAPLSEAWDATFFALHGWLTKLMLGLLVLHAGGALIRYFRHRDRTLARMVRG